MTRAKPINCPYCGSRHMPRFLCDTAAGLLQAMLDKARKKGIGVDGLDEAYESGDTVLRSLDVTGVSVDVAGGTYPGVRLAATDLAGRKLPPWTYASDPESLVKMPELILAAAQQGVALAAD